MRRAPWTTVNWDRTWSDFGHDGRKYGVRLKIEKASMASKATRDSRTVAVIGAGVSGLVCSSSLAKAGFKVSVFDMGRGPGGRMSQRREQLPEGKVALFDHGAQKFTAESETVKALLDTWEKAGVVAKWSGNIGALNAISSQFERARADSSQWWVGTSGMNSICQFLVSHNGILSNFETIVRKIERVSCKDNNSKEWRVFSDKGLVLGQFQFVILAAAYKTFPVEIVNPPTNMERLLPVEADPCFAVMLAFESPLTMLQFDCASVQNSEKLSTISRDSSKPGRKLDSGIECWVLHSTKSYARETVANLGMGKISREALNSIAEELFDAFKASVGFQLPYPIFMRTHRWGGAFPVRPAHLDSSRNCFVDETKTVIACGDYCVAPNVESAILSGLEAATVALAHESDMSRL